jgi:hypothetical protein
MPPRPVQDRPRLEEILDLCQEYVAAGWMTAAQYQTYQHILHQHPDTLEYVAKDIQDSLMIRNMEKSTATDPLNRCIYLPQEFHKVRTSSTDPQHQQQSLKELFVEMCFYARLGYIQPPCCLQCAYQNSTQNAAATATCSRWVVWRRNAHEILHPDTLPDNIVFLPCSVAQSLLQSPNKTWDGYFWDSMQKQLIHTTTK